MLVLFGILPTMQYMYTFWIQREKLKLDHLEHTFLILLRCVILVRFLLLLFFKFTDAVQIKSSRISWVWVLEFSCIFFGITSSNHDLQVDVQHHQIVTNHNDKSFKISYCLHLKYTVILKVLDIWRHVASFYTHSKLPCNSSVNTPVYPNRQTWVTRIELVLSVYFTLRIRPKRSLL